MVKNINHRSQELLTLLPAFPTFIYTIFYQLLPKSQLGKVSASSIRLVVCLVYSVASSQNLLGRCKCYSGPGTHTNAPWETGLLSSHMHEQATNSLLMAPELSGPVKSIGV